MTTTGTGPLENGLVLCRVRTGISGRLVSLPFSDHCDPLVDGQGDLLALSTCLPGQLRDTRSSGLELRPRFVVPHGLAKGASYWLHTLDLTPSAERIFRGFHASCTRRAVRRAQRESLTCEAGSSERLLTGFYELLRLTRRRHGLPPQPIMWFRNLIDCLGDGLVIHVASKNGQPVAAIVTLSFKDTLVYKYGGSDSRYHRLGSVPFVFWRAILWAKAQGIEKLDLGRSALDIAGRLLYKHLG